MNKEFIPYEQALELMKLGFDEPCLAWYNSQGVLLSDFTYGFDEDFLYQIEDFPYNSSQSLAPLYQQAFRWLREKFNIHYFIERDGDVYNAVCDAYLIVVCNTYEQAEQVCLLRLIDLAKQK